MASSSAQAPPPCIAGTPGSYSHSSPRNSAAHGSCRTRTSPCSVRFSVSANTSPNQKPRVELLFHRTHARDSHWGWTGIETSTTVQRFGHARLSIVANRELIEMSVPKNRYCFPMLNFKASCIPRGPPPPRNGLPMPTSPVATIG
jgi:hypothetical protein